MLFVHCSYVHHQIIWVNICCIINVNFVTSFLRKHVSTSKVCLFGYYKETLVIGIANLKSECVLAC